MRLILQRKGAAESGLKRYNGGGIYNLIRRKSHFSGLKKDTKVEERKVYPHKFVDFVVNGSPQKKKEKKRKLPISTKEASSPRAKKFSTNTTNQLINSGSGIVLD